MSIGNIIDKRRIDWKWISQPLSLNSFPILNILFLTIFRFANTLLTYISKHRHIMYASTFLKKTCQNRSIIHYRPKFKIALAQIRPLNGICLCYVTRACFQLLRLMSCAFFAARNFFSQNQELSFRVICDLFEQILVIFCKPYVKALNNFCLQKFRNFCLIYHPTIQNQI